MDGGSGVISQLHFFLQTGNVASFYFKKEEEN
jgi:hypothetical protein